jgi:hypothetical protein
VDIRLERVLGSVSRTLCLWRREGCDQNDSGSLRTAKVIFTFTAGRRVARAHPLRRSWVPHVPLLHVGILTFPFYGWAIHQPLGAFEMKSVSQTRALASWAQRASRP